MSEQSASDDLEEQSFIDFDDEEHADEVPFPASPRPELDIDEGEESDRSLDSLTALHSSTLSPVKPPRALRVVLSVTLSKQTIRHPFKMTDHSAVNVNLPKGIKLRGKENYSTWKEQVVNIAISNDIAKFIHPRYKAPE